MNLLSNWKSEAICFGDKHSSRWTSYNINDIEYAKDGCSRCPVKRECLVSAVMNDSFVGVVAGISEYEYLTYTWREAGDVNESNWERDDRVLPILLQKAQ